jgi:hypothetical protein
MCGRYASFALRFPGNRWGPASGGGGWGDGRQRTALQVAGFTGPGAATPCLTEINEVCQAGVLNAWRETNGFRAVEPSGGGRGPCRPDAAYRPAGRQC